MKNWQGFALEHGHIGATVMSETEMSFPNMYGMGMGCTLTKIAGGYIETAYDGKETNYDTIRDWLGY